MGEWEMHDDKRKVVILKAVDEEVTSELHLWVSLLI